MALAERRVSMASFPKSLPMTPPLKNFLVLLDWVITALEHAHAMFVPKRV